MRGFDANSNKGFSIIELMIVVAIIGILAAVAVPSYLKHVYRTRQAEGVHRLLDIKTAQEKYYALNDEYFNIADLSTSVDAEFNGMLNFAVGSTEFHNFAITSPGGINNDSRIELFSDLNKDGDAEMCWVIKDSTTEPRRLNDVAVAGPPPYEAAVSGLGNKCDYTGAAEELGFSTMFFGPE